MKENIHSTNTQTAKVSKTKNYIENNGDGLGKINDQMKKNKK
jgi:hypothetical protein